MPDALSEVNRIGAELFLPLRKLFGPLHRRRPTFVEEPEKLAPLAPPWSDDRWFSGDFPPRSRNALRALIDGEEYLDELYKELLEARSRVTIAGWCLTPLMPLLRGSRQNESVLANVLHTISDRVDVYVLLWSGAQALIQPTKSHVEQVRRTLLELAPRIRCELDHTASASHDHHQKAVTIDGRIAFLGGMDLTTFQGDRYDRQKHPLRFGANWHDVQMRLQGEVVRDVQENFCQRWDAVTGESLEPLPDESPDPSWQTPAQIIRTIPKGFYPFASEGEFGIYRSLITAIKKARRYVYLENQYIWAPEIVEALCEVMGATREDPVRIVLVLPARAENGRYDNDEHVRDLTEADGGRGIFSAYALYTGGVGATASGYEYRPIYAHAKVSIVDDEWFSVGSANLNRRGFATDAEMNVQSIDPESARSLRIRLWAEHLGLSEEKVGDTDVRELIDVEWPAAASSLERCIKSGSPPVKSQVRAYVPERNVGSRVLDTLQDMILEH